MCLAIHHCLVLSFILGIIFDDTISVLYTCTDEGWSVYPPQASCYKFVEISKAWDDAADFCTASNGHLALSGTQDELAFLENLLGSTAAYSR